MAHLSSLPMIPGYQWRTMQPGDAPALAHFEQICAAPDGTMETNSADTWHERLADSDAAARNSIVAVNDSGAIAASGWLWYQERTDEIQAFLAGLVHPRWRGQGIGGALLTWLEDRATANITPQAQGRRRVLRVLFFHHAAQSIELIEAHGYQFQNAEDGLACDLRGPLPTQTLPAALSLETFSAAIVDDFYSVYCDAFSTRMATIWEKEQWQHWFANLDDGLFVPELSLLVRDAGEAVAYAICHSEKPESAELRHLGVRRAWRTRGIASALLAESLRRYAAAGYATATISVNVNNPKARQLYERVGFVLTAQYRVYGKILSEAA